MATIAVVMGTYNGADYLREQLRSILDQTRPPDQIIISDDASTDGTVAIARRALEGFAGDVIITANSGPRGVVRNFTHGLELASTDLIALSDQDDVWHPDKLEKMIAPFERRPHLLLLHSDARLVDAVGAPNGDKLLQSLTMSTAIKSEVHGGHAAGILLRRNFVTGATTVIRRELLASAMPVPDGWLHDEWLAMVAASIGELDLVEEDLIDYRQHGSNEVGATVLGVVGRARRISESRAERNVRLLTRAEQLPERLVALRADGDLVAEALQKLHHERMRSDLPAGRFRRIPPVAGALLRGSYRRYGRGALDAVRDLFQPV